jgi:hypothetical protein
MGRIANAECAWVLWEHWEIDTIIDEKIKHDELWKIIQATPKYEQCLETQRGLFEIMKNRLTQEKNPKQKIEAVSYTLIILSSDRQNDSHTFYCFPDTIDPRK